MGTSFKSLPGRQQILELLHFVALGLCYQLRTPLAARNDNDYVFNLDYAWRRLLSTQSIFSQLGMSLRRRCVPAHLTRMIFTV